METLEFNYEQETAEFVNAYSLLKWIRDLHTELTNTGCLPDHISTETHQQLMILAKIADAIVSNLT
jgi:hypothetical protein